MFAAALAVLVSPPLHSVVDGHSLLSLLPLLPLAKGQFEQSKGNTELNRAAFTQEHVPYP